MWSEIANSFNSIGFRSADSKIIGFDHQLHYDSVIMLGALYISCVWDKRLEQLIEREPLLLWNKRGVERYLDIFL